MGRQADINDKMRAILVDWLVEVHLKFKLTPETLFLTTNLIDRFLALHPVTRKHLQLVGVTAMLIASKYEEIWAPEVKDFVYISDNAYDKDQILAMVSGAPRSPTATGRALAELAHALSLSALRLLLLQAVAPPLPRSSGPCVSCRRS